MTIPFAEPLIAIAVLYVAECIIAVRRDAMVFWTWVGTPARITFSQNLLGPQGWGLFLRPPLPPLGRLYQAQFCPVSFDLNGVGNVPSHRLGRESLIAGGEQFIPYDEIRSVATDGQSVLLNDAPFAACAADGTAGVVADLIRQLHDAAPQNRGALLCEAMEQSLDGDEANKVLQSLRRPVSAVQLSANLLFVFLFVATPLILISIGLVRTWPGLLAGLLFLWIATTLSARRRHATLYPDRQAERRAGVMVMALTPMAAIRAHDLLTRHALSRFHPLAVARAVCGADRFREFAQDVLRDLTYPGRRDADENRAAASAADFMRERLRQACESMLHRVGCEPAELLAAPAPGDERSLSYCPRCRGQFYLEAGECTACRVDLQPFEKPGRRNAPATPEAAAAIKHMTPAAAREEVD